MVDELIALFGKEKALGILNRMVQIKEATNTQESQRQLLNAVDHLSLDDLKVLRDDVTATKS